MAKLIKKQHYVPRMVLRRFCDADGKIWEFNLNSQKITKRRIEELCASNLLYEIRDEDGQFFYPDRKNCFEKGLGRIENEYSPFFDDLLKQLQNKNFVDLSENDIGLINFWIALLLLRNPLVKAAMPLVSKDFNIYINDDLKKSYNFISLMPKGIEWLSKELRRGHIRFLKVSPYRAFVITDIPIWIGNPIYKYCYMPLSSEYALEIKETKTILENCNRCEIIQLSSKETDDLNVMMFLSMRSIKVSEFECGNSVMSSDEFLLKGLAARSI